MICRADGRCWSTAARLPEVPYLFKETICRDLMNTWGTGSGLFLQAFTIKNGESRFITACVSGNHGAGPTTYHVVMVDSARRYQAQTREPLPLHSPGAARSYCLLAPVAAHSFWTHLLRTMARQIDEIRAGTREALSNDYGGELTPDRWSGQLLENERQQTQRSSTSTSSTIRPSLKTGWRSSRSPPRSWAMPRHP